MDKYVLRAEFRTRRDAAERTPLPVPSQFVERLYPGLILASYMPVGSEADPAPFVQAAVAAGCVLALPHVVDRATPIRFLAWELETALAAGPFGLSQPAAHAAELAPAIILTPLLGFDRRGNRIGQGAGHYDRAFAAHAAAWRVGLARSVQEVAAIEQDPWDMPLHAVATEKEWITTMADHA